jgi:hypothetical protein
MTPELPSRTRAAVNGPNSTVREANEVVKLTRRRRRDRRLKSTVREANEGVTRLRLFLYGRRDRQGFYLAGLLVNKKSLVRGLKDAGGGPT